MKAYGRDNGEHVHFEQFLEIFEGTDGENIEEKESSVDKINAQIAKNIIYFLNKDKTLHLNYIFNEISNYTTNTFSFKHFKQWLQKMNIQLSHEEETELNQYYDENKSG